MRETDGDRRLRVAFLGDRGIPAKYGGFSTLIEEVATALVAEHDFDVTVYCRRGYYDSHPAAFNGVHLEYLPALPSKHFESLSHTGLSVLHALFARYDAVFVVDPGNAVLLWPLRLFRLPFATHTDGLGWQRRKWGRLASAYYRYAERLAAWFSNELVTDARAMQRYYEQSYGARSVFIPYGSAVGDAADSAGLRQLGLEAGDYFLVVTRIEPDNNTDLIVAEYQRSGATRPLVIVGGARYPSAYSRALEAQASDSVRFVGPVYDSGLLNGLYANAFAYLHGHEVGGTNPSLLRAMHGGAACIAIDVVFHREVLGDASLYFGRETGSLAAIIRRLETDPGESARLARQARERASTLYRWDAVAAAYADLLRHLQRRERCPEVYFPERFVSPATSPPSGRAE